MTQGSDQEDLQIEEHPEFLSGLTDYKFGIADQSEPIAVRIESQSSDSSGAELAKHGPQDYEDYQDQTLAKLSPRQSTGRLNPDQLSGSLTARNTRGGARKKELRDNSGAIRQLQLSMSLLIMIGLVLSLCLALSLQKIVLTGRLPAEQKLEFDKNWFGDNSLVVAVDLNNIGSNLCRARKWQEAKAPLEDALKRKVNRHDVEAESLKKTILHLTGAYLATNDFEQAAVLLDSALAKLQKEPKNKRGNPDKSPTGLESWKPNVERAKLLTKFSTVLLWKDQKERAESLAREAYELAGQDSDRDTRLWALISLITSEYSNEHTEQAKKHLIELSELLTRKLGKDWQQQPQNAPENAQYEALAGAIEYHDHNYVKSCAHYEKSVECAKKSYGIDDERTLALESRLAGSLARCNRLQESENLYKLSLGTHIPTAISGDWLKTWRKYRDLVSSTGNPSEASKLSQRIAVLDEQWQKQQQQDKSKAEELKLSLHNMQFNTTVPESSLSSFGAICLLVWLILIWRLSGHISATIAEYKGRNTDVAFVMGVLCLPIAWILYAILPSKVATLYAKDWRSNLLNASAGWTALLVCLDIPAAASFMLAKLGPENLWIFFPASWMMFAWCTLLGSAVVSGFAAYALNKKQIPWAVSGLFGAVLVPTILLTREKDLTVSVLKKSFKNFLRSGCFRFLIFVTMMITLLYAWFFRVEL